MAGYVLHEDSERVVICTDNPNPKRVNAKTGRMLQVWVLVRYVSPIESIRGGQDSLVCGACPLRGTGGKGRACYVRIDNAPTQIYKAYQAGRYPYLHRPAYPDVFAGRMIRWGAYGDPAYIPLPIIYGACQFAKGWTGYTHQWRTHGQLKTYVMASVDSERERVEASGQGWRTFRVRAAGQSVGQGEIDCPASNESGHKTTCAKCGLCNGARPTHSVSDLRKDISTLVHGIGAKSFQLVQLQKQGA